MKNISFQDLQEEEERESQHWGLTSHCGACLKRNFLPNSFLTLEKVTWVLYPKSPVRDAQNDVKSKYCTFQSPSVHSPKLWRRHLAWGLSLISSFYSSCQHLVPTPLTSSKLYPSPSITGHLLPSSFLLIPAETLTDNVGIKWQWPRSELFAF